MNTLQRIARIWVGNPAIDLAVVIPLAVLLTLTLRGNQPGNTASRGVFLQAAVGVSVGAVAFAITGASIVFAVTPGEKLRSIIRTAGYQLARIIGVSVLTLIWIATALSFAIVFEDENPYWLLVPAELTLTAYSALIQMRLAWLLSKILSLLALER